MGKDNDTLENFGPLKDEKSKLKEKNIEKDHKNLIKKSLDTRNYTRKNLLGRIFQDKLFANKFSLFFKKIGFSKQEFSTSKAISNI